MRKDFPMTASSPAENSAAENYSALVRFLLFYAILANIPYWILSRDFETASIGWFCVQYATVGVVSLYVPRMIASLLLLLITLTDLLCGVSISYLLPIRECLSNIIFIHTLHSDRLFYAVAITLLCGMTTLIAFFIPGKHFPKKQRWIGITCLVIFGLSFTVVDFVMAGFRTGEYRAPWRPESEPDMVALASYKYHRLTRFPLLEVMHLVEDESLRAVMDERSRPAPVPSAMASALQLAHITQNSQKPNIVLILVESWGLAVNDSLRQSLAAPYGDPNLLARYSVKQGTVPFYGPTIAGEARELCGTSIGFRLLNSSSNDLKSCVPQQLASRGYLTIGLHGNSGNIFNRRTWYSNIGFQEASFHYEFRKLRQPDCVGPFPGTCDSNIAQLIRQRLSKPDPNPYFIHWLTLNSHLPVSIPAPLSNPLPCPAFVGESNSPICSWYQLVANVHQEASHMAMGDLARPTVFVIVGDHAPPFAGPELRSRFSQKEVPYVILVPRSIAADSATELTRSTKDGRAAAGGHPAIPGM